MALPPGNPDTFMREVDDAVRADRAQDFVRRFGIPIIAIMVVGLLGFGGWMLWQHRGDAHAGEHGQVLSAALDQMQQGRPKAGSAAVEPLAKGDDPTYRALALMAQGNATAGEGDMRTAAARFGMVANDSAIEQSLRDTALLRQTLAEYDTLEPAAVVARLRSLAGGTGPAFASAAELSALAELKRGNEAAAGALFKRIAEDDAAPESLKSRAVQMAGMLGIDAVETSGEDAAPAPARAATATKKNGE